MKQWVYISLMLLSTVFLLSCKDDELENVNVEDRMPELTLKFTEAEISRTSLNSSEPLQHVENVKLYIYQMDATEGTPETAEQFVQRIQGATLYATEILPWKNQSTSSGVSMSYKIQTPLEPGGEYVFLAVGTDAESEENYEFPTIDNSPKFKSAQARFKGETLSEQELREKMAKSEFFSGYQVAKLCSPDAGSKSILAPLKKDDAGNYSYDTADQTTVELTRAVAGVLLYMTDIPAKWNKAGESGDGYRVTKVKLRLHRMPASSVSLCGQSAGTGGSTEAGTEEGPVLIESMDLSELQFPSEGDLYQIVGQKGEVQTLDNTLLYGAYLLPVASEPGKATFILELWGKPCEADGTIQEGAVEEELDSFECFLEETNSSASSSDFAIERNHVYCIGQKPVADDTEGDAPVSLAGKVIVVDVQDWIPISNDIEFPYVDTNAKFNPDFDPGYVFNCINASFELPIVCNSNSKWELSVPDGCDWLYIKQTDGSWAKTYTQERSSDVDAKSNPKTLTLFIMDYAEYRASYDNLDIKNDIRTIDLELRTIGNDGTTGKESIVKTTPLTIKQYNAISVTFKVEKGTWPNKYEDSYGVGFSRLDLGDEFYKTKEEAMADFGDDSTRKWEGVAHTPVNSRKAYGWGYWSSYDIFRDSADEYIGKSVIQDLRTGVSYYIDYWGENIALSEAITFCPKVPAEITKALNYDKSIYSNIKNSAYDFWYLPSEKELENFMYLAKKTSSFNLLEGGWYWIVNEEDVKNNQSYAFQYSLSNSLKKELKNRKCGTQVSDFGNGEGYEDQYGTQKIFIRPCLSFGIVSTTKK